MPQQSNCCDRIIVRLEVEIPAGVAAPRIVLPGAAEEVAAARKGHDRPHDKRFAIAECRIQYTNTVLFRGSGTASQDQVYGYPKTAHAVVVHEDEDPDDTTIDPSAVEVNVDQGSGDWAFAGYKRVRKDNVCNHEDPRFKMFVWFKYTKPYFPDKIVTEESATVTVVCADLPFCSHAAVALAAPKAAPAVAIQQLHYRWELAVEGFVGRAVKPFNGRWPLKIGAEQDGRTLVIDNADEKTPVAVSVRLDLESGDGVLELRHKKLTATYWLTGGGFRGDAPNNFHFANLAGLEGNCSFPATIGLAPAKL